MHPIIEQFARINGIDACRPDFFRRVQRELRDEVQPLLDERERLLEENIALKAQVETMKTKKKSEAA